MEVLRTSKSYLSAVLAETSLREGEDFYLDGPYVAFTEAYHLRRGTCCGSGCRHCPFPRAGSTDVELPDEAAADSKPA